MSQTLALLPQPRLVKEMGGSFLLTAEVGIVSLPDLEAEAAYLTDQLTRLLGRESAPAVEGARKTRIALVLDATESKSGAEGYHLSVTEDGARITAATAAGMFYGIQTLLQSISESTGGTCHEIPCYEIEDSPKFAWRGLLVDVGRFFLPVSDVKKLIDLMAAYKLNVLHLHLTEDQGWRLQIDAFPELTQIGAYRAETLIGHLSQDAGARRFDGRPHGGFYSKQDIRDLVAHASERHITVVPEIEMPGHAQAALACYPDLSCTGGPFEVSRLWGVHHDVFCAGNEQVFSFLEAVLDETLELFPSEFIHIGGDECPKDRWKECPKCQKRIQEEGLADEHELQSWFIRRMERYLGARGRRLIGWDEILEGGLPPGATVGSWRGEEGGIAAAKSGHDVVMMPNASTYFDYYQAEPAGEPLAIGGLLTLRKTYEYQPIPSALNPVEARHVLGTQGLLWAEFIPTMQHLEYMMFPRAFALAEVAWGTSDPDNYEGFLTRLGPHLQRLEDMGVNYRRLDS